MRRERDTLTYRYIQQFAVLVNAFEKLAAKKLHTHNRKYQPEHETDEEHVEYTRYRIHQRVHYDLARRKKKQPDTSKTLKLSNRSTSNLPAVVYTGISYPHALPSRYRSQWSQCSQSSQ